MPECKKLERRSRSYVQEFFAFRGKKSSVPSGCVLAGIRYVAALAGMNNYPSWAAPGGFSAKTATQSLNSMITVSTSA